MNLGIQGLGDERKKEEMDAEEFETEEESKTGNIERINETFHCAVKMLVEIMQLFLMKGLKDEGKQMLMTRHDSE